VPADSCGLLQGAVDPAQQELALAAVARDDVAIARDPGQREERQKQPRLQGDQIREQDVAYTVYSFATNSSAYGAPRTAIRLLQVIVGATPDGVMGPVSLEALNAMEPRLFLALFSLARIARYRDIVTRDRSQGKFLLGWINRTLQEAA
jgi:lysozyme family protein